MTRSFKTIKDKRKIPKRYSDFKVENNLTYHGKRKEKRSKTNKSIRNTI